VSGSVVAIVPAAGAATRFGGDKLTVDVDGRPLLDRTLAALLDGGVNRLVLVGAATGAFGAVPAATDRRVRTVINPDPSRGMFSSIQCGLAEADADGWIVVLPADMPFVKPETVARLLDTASATGPTPISACVPAFAGRRGHPIVLSGRLRGPLLAQPASTNLKAALASLKVQLHEVRVDDGGVLRDVDVRADLQH
jgi:molybdenum cofactor cytidylyltransferase